MTKNSAQNMWPRDILRIQVGRGSFYPLKGFYQSPTSARGTSGTSIETRILLGTQGFRGYVGGSVGLSK